jgi:branched-chain amino acid transport system substrate-binding protein
MANDEQQGKALAQFAGKTLAAKSVAIIDDRTAYGQGLADEFKKAAEAAGLKVVASEYTNDKATDFKAILTKIKSKKPDLIFYGGMDPQGGPMAKQMKELGLKAKFLTGDGGCTPNFITLAGAAAEGQYCSLPGVPLDKMPGGTAFKDKFVAKFKSEIQLYAPYVYDATMVLVDAMKRANSVEPAKYLPEIGKTSFQGVTAKIGFDELGDLKDGAISFYEYKGGKIEYVETLGGTPEAAPAAAPAEAPAAAAPAAAAPAPAPAAAAGEKK